jgi:hypothetical protein
MKKVSLNELMGKKGGKKNLSVSDLPDLLGERMPKIDYTPVGKFRLVTALRNRFGENYRQLEGIESLLADFDRESSFNVTKQEMKMIKPRKKG